jgi:putative PEP-CTERM system TPR-repeat lipoprotein
MPPAGPVNSPHRAFFLRGPQAANGGGIGSTAARAAPARRPRPLIFRTRQQAAGPASALRSPRRVNPMTRTFRALLPLLCSAALLLPGFGLADALDKARADWRAGRLVEAHLQLKTILQDRPEDAQARLLLGQLYLDLRRGAPAEEELRRAEALGIGAAEVLPLRLDALLHQREWQRTLDAAAAAGAQGVPETAELLAIRGVAEAGLGRLNEAQTLFGRALTLDPGHERALLEQAKLAFGRGDRARADELVQTALGANPDASRSLAAAAELKLQARDFAAAEALYTRALERARDRWMIFYKRALARIELTDLEGAAADIEAGAKQFPDFAGYAFARGRLAFARDDFAGALPPLEVFLRSNPKDPGANLYAGAAALRLGQLEQAREYLSQHVAMAPGSRRGHLLLASAQSAQRDFAAAEATLRGQLSPAQPDPAVVLALAQVLQQQGRLDEARPLYRQYLTLSPEDADAKRQYAALLTATGDTAGSERQLAAVLADAPADLAARMQQVANAVAAEDAAKAQALADRLVADFPDSAPTRSARAAALVLGGRMDAARKALEEALELDPGFADAALKLARMALMDGDQASARRYYEQVLTHDPANSRALLRLTQLDVAGDDKAAGIGRLEDALRKNPEAVDLRLNLVNGYLAAERSDEALGLLYSVPPGLDEDPRILAARARMELAAGRPFNARTAADQLVDVAPDSAGAQFLLASVLVRANAVADALIAAVEGFRLDPDHREAAPTLSLVLGAATPAQREVLIRDLRQVLGDHPLADYGEARRLQLAGDKAGALRVLKRLHGRNPDDPAWFEALLRGRVDADESAAAIRLAETWLKRHPNDQATRLNLAQLLAEAGRTAEAVNTYRAVLADAPENAVALNNLANLMLSEKPEEALSLARRAREAAPDSPAIADTLGLALLATGDEAAATALLRQAHEAMPTDAQVQLHYARALVASGDGERARPLLLQLAGRSFDGDGEVDRLLRELR